MKIFMNKAGENWILDRIHKEWYEHNPSVATMDIDGCDVVWLMAAWMWRAIPANVLSAKKVVCTIHHIAPDKFGEAKMNDFALRDQFVDAYHVPNKYTAAFISNFTNKPVHVISYWLNPSLWSFTTHTQGGAKEALGISDKFVIGSFQRDTEGGDLKSPKLEKGPDLFCDYVERVVALGGREVLVLLGGWRRQYVIERLEKAKIQYKYIEMAPHNKIAQMYTACDLYVVSSRHEGGPQAVFEAASMKVPIISSRVGVVEEVLCKECIIDIKKDVYFPSTRDVEENHKNVQQYNIETHKQNYLNMFQEVMEN